MTLRRPPSSLYTFRTETMRLGSGLARRDHARAFPDFDGLYSRRFQRGTQLRKSVAYASFATPPTA
jgi:hypothetical protein